MFSGKNRYVNNEKESYKQFSHGQNDRFRIFLNISYKSYTQFINILWINLC